MLEVSGLVVQNYSVRSWRPVSTGIRFTTLPDATPPSFQTTPSHLPSAHRGPPSQPPTTITALFNPMLGHISAAYTARVSRELSLSSRYDFNVYSYESEWCMGAEWWLRRGKGMFTSALGSSSEESKDELSEHHAPPPSHESIGEVQGVVKARASTTTVRVLARALLRTPPTLTLRRRTSLCCGKDAFTICWSASASSRT